MTPSKDKRAVQELTGRIVRLDRLLAIQEDQIQGLRDTVDHYKHCFYLEFRRNEGLTSTVSTLQSDATKGDNPEGEQA